MPQAAALRDVLLRHTTTLGVRRQMVTRYSVERRIETVDTVYGSVRVKVATLADGQIKAAPEHDVSVREVWRLVAEGMLPPPVKIGRCSVWFGSDISEFQMRLREQRERKQI